MGRALLEYGVENVKNFDAREIVNRETKLESSNVVDAC